MARGPMVILSGAGLSVASGIPTFRDADGLWEGHDIMDVATPSAWRRDPDLVRRFYDLRRIGVEAAHPNAAHLALARLQAALGPSEVTLVTQNVDGLLGRAGCAEVIEMHGALNRLRCARSLEHPRVSARGAQDPEARCAACGAPMRPDIVWFGEMPYDMEAIERRVMACGTFVSIGTSGVVYPAAGLVVVARAAGARTIEVNPKPTGGGFHEVVTAPAEVAVPELVEAWLAGR